MVLRHGLYVLRLSIVLMLLRCGVIVVFCVFHVSYTEHKSNAWVIQSLDIKNCRWLSKIKLCKYNYFRKIMLRKGDCIEREILLYDPMYSDILILMALWVREREGNLVLNGLKI